MKRIIPLLLILALLFPLSACGGSAGETSGARVQIVTTSFPLYDWTRNVVGEAPDVEIVWLMDSGVDPHSFQPTVQDLTKVSDSDLFVYMGGESDQWAEDALQEAVNEGLLALNLLNALGDAAVEEADVPGAEPEAEEEDGALDEHIWMSLRNAELCVNVIAEALVEIDPDCADLYWANAERYSAALRALDLEYAAVAAESDLRVILVADRFPFRYLAEDYDLDYYAAFSGCSAETEASFRTVLGLTEKVDELGLPVILITENGDGGIAETVSESAETAPVIRTLDSLQSVTAKIADEGVTYLTIMEKNLTVLKEALLWHS